MSNATAKRSMMDRMMAEINASAARPPVFLQAWKDGIGLAGESYFHVTTATVADATDKDELRPDFDVIKYALPALSSGQQRLMIAMCQFYSDSGTRMLCEDAGVALPSLGGSSHARRRAPIGRDPTDGLI